MVTPRRRSRLPASIQLELIKHFVAGATGRSAAELTSVNRHTATLYFHKLRELIAERLEAEAPDLLAGEIEVNESYFGGVRKGNRGWDAVGKVPVFGLLKRGSKERAVVIPNAQAKTLIVSGGDVLIAKLQHQLSGLRRHQFGSRSESIDQLELTLEEEEIARAAATPPGEDEKANQTNGEKRKPRRKPLPDHLHRNDQVLSPGEACNACGGSLKTLGEDVTEELEYVPGRFVVNL